MDCRRAQQLVSPYLDEQLTGVEMLEMQDHLGICPQCAEEYWTAREIKHLLRDASISAPNVSLEERILRRLAEEERRGESLLPIMANRLALPAIWRAPIVAVVPPISRGRRFAAAFAFSCLAVLVVSAPFASSTVEGRADINRTKSAVFNEMFPVAQGASSDMGAAGNFDSLSARPADDVIDDGAQFAAREVVFITRSGRPRSNSPADASRARNAVGVYSGNGISLVDYHLP